MLEIIETDSQSWSPVGQMKKRFKISGEVDDEEERYVERLFQGQVDKSMNLPTSRYSNLEKREIKTRVHNYLDEHMNGKVNAMYTALEQARDPNAAMPSLSSFQRFMRSEMAGKDDVVDLCERFLLQSKADHPLDRLGQTLQHYYQLKGTFVHKSRFEKLAGPYRVSCEDGSERSRKHSSLWLEYVPDAPFFRVREFVFNRFALKHDPGQTGIGTRTEGVAMLRGQSLWIVLRDCLVRTEKQYLVALSDEESGLFEGTVVDRVLNVAHSIIGGDLNEFPVALKRRDD